MRYTRALMVSMLLLAACATYAPLQDPDADFIQRAEVKEKGDVRVSVGVPTRAEAKRWLGVDVGAKKIQPVWIKVENGSDQDFVLLPLSVDPDYYSAAEAAWKSHWFLRSKANRQIDDVFVEQRVPTRIQPGETASGLVYTNYQKGLKYVEVDLRGEEKVYRMAFQIEIRGYQLDYHQVDWDNLYPPGAKREVDEAGLEAYLESLPCCALGGDQKTPGDPLNLAVVAPEGALGSPFLRQGWDVTETIRLRTVFGTVASSLFGRIYKNSPISALYVFDRPQDLALQKARNTVDERNHLRLWLTPVTFEGANVWVGQISRDIGVRLTTKTITTHKIDPETDDARFYLLQDLVNSGAVARFGYVKGVDFAPRETPRRNFTGDPYFTDGLRAVFFLSPDYVEFDEIDWMTHWEDPDEAMEAGEQAAQR